MVAPISSTPYFSRTPASSQRHRGVERGLAAQGREQRVGALLGDHLLDELGGDRLDVGRVGELGVGHDRGRVGVDQDDPDALGLEHPAGLGAGVVELAGLADDDRPGADHQDGLDVVALGHQARSPRIRSTNRSKRYAASCGPAAASGWYCTEKLAARRPASIAQLEPLDHVVVEADVAHRRLAVRRRASVASSGASTANPWLCAVTSTLPVVRSITGWLMPRWPYLSL